VNTVDRAGAKDKHPGRSKIASDLSPELEAKQTCVKEIYMRLQDVRFKSLSVGFMGAGLLGLVLTTGTTLRAQDDAKPAQQEQPKDEAKPMQPNETKPETRPQDAKPTKPEDAKPAANDKQDEKAMKPAQDHPAQNNNSDHAMRASGQNQKIPDDKFKANFGRQHTFRVQTTVVEGQTRFQYGGYWFGLGNAWPVAWAYTDPCYVDYIDGEYVLIDLAHPGIQIPLIIVVM
jgi:pyruvate/2-oxoglutarate dehydrogenase complex dihydrolipoamide acyltransferase (E2) component